jgi:hypothetical protein
LDFGFWILDWGLGVGILDFGFWTRNAKGKANANSTSFGFWIGELRLGAWGLVIGNWGLGLGTWGVCLGGLNFNPKSKIQNPKSLMLLSLYSPMRSVWQLLVTVSKLTKL